MQPSRFLSTLCLSTCLCLSLFCATAQATDTQPTTKSLSPAEYAKRILDDLAESGDTAAAQQRARAFFAYVATHARQADTRSMVEAAYARRLTAQLAQVEPQARDTLLPYLRQHDTLARTLAFVIADGENPKPVFAMLDKLRAAYGDKPADYPSLTAALCVVHDAPLRRRVNENKVATEDPVALFDYYTTNENKMLFGVRKVPAELLVWVVDCTATLDEMRWALDRYRGDTNVGKRFFDIAYDHEHFRKGTKKKVTEKGFDLPNIKKYGGVCADQAYFAVSVGKAIGVPTTYVTGQSASVGHAWVGFLQARGNTGQWNFNVGRYRAYQGVRGNVQDPQTRRRIPDSYVSLRAELIGTRLTDRHAAIALTDAALYLRQLDEHEAETPPTVEGLALSSLAKPRRTDATTQLALLRDAVRRNKGDARAWFAVRALAKRDQMTFAQKKQWANEVQKVCGRSYPDFTLAMLKPMIESIDDPREQTKLWDAAFKLFTKRKDLAAEVRVAQGDLWRAHGEPQKAGRYYEDVITRFANAGPFVIGALKATEQMLVADDKADRVTTLYAQTWQRIQKPGNMAGTFQTQSNWYRVGMLYAQKLEQHGDADEAQAVRAKIHGVVGK